MAQTKTLYHGELAKMGPVRVTIMSDVLKSKYKDKNDYVILKMPDGADRNYNTENENCANFFRGQKNRTFTIVAEGSRAEAVIVYVGEAATPPPQAPPPPQQPPPQHAPPAQYQPPPVPQGGYHAPPPARQTSPPPAPRVDAEAELKKAKRLVAQNLTLAKIATKAVGGFMSELAKMYNWESIDQDTFRMYFATALYGISNAINVRDLPVNIDALTLEVVRPKTAAAPPTPTAVAPPAPAAPPPPPPAPEPPAKVMCSKCGKNELDEQGYCPECDDVPF